MVTRSDGESGDEQLGQLLAEIEALDNEYWDARTWAVAGWQYRLGPLQLRGRFSSGSIANIYLAFCAVTLLGGGVLAVLDPTRELGVALVVGAIFAGGAFVAQWWTLQVDNERRFAAEVHGPDMVRYFRQLIRRRNRLIAKVERLYPGYFDDE